MSQQWPEKWPNELLENWKLLLYFVTPNQGSNVSVIHFNHLQFLM